MITMLVFTIGGAAGAAIGYAFHHGLLTAAKDTARQEAKEFATEIQRLRAQVALHINKV